MKMRMNWAKAKHRIDSSVTREKVNHFDPAAAPLGTDEEAGGASTRAEDIAASLGTRNDADASRDNRKQ